MKGYEHVDENLAGSLEDTAVLLVGTMHAHGLPRTSVLRSDSGFWITPALGEILNAPDGEPEPEPVKRTRRTKKTSGDGAVKNETEE